MTTARPERVRFEHRRLTGDVRHADARGVVRAREGALVVAREGGRVGIGEASPLPGVSREPLSDCLDALDALGPSLEVALDPRTLAADPRLLSLPAAARMGLETALLDLAAQRAGVSLAALLAEGGAAAPRVSTQVLVSSASEAGAIARALATGACALKLKIGAPGEVARDRVLLAEARALGPDVLLRADANEAGLGPALLDALVLCRVELCEDPWPLAELEAPGRARLPFPVALDAAVVRDANAALAAARRGVCAALVLKPTALGGLLRARSLAAEARALGVRAIVSHALESPVGVGACAHLALALGADETHGLGRYEGLERFRVDGDADPIAIPSWLGPCAIDLPPGPGLGVDLTEVSEP